MFIGCQIPLKQATLLRQSQNSGIRARCPVSPSGTSFAGGPKAILGFCSWALSGSLPASSTRAESHKLAGRAPPHARQASVLASASAPSATPIGRSYGAPPRICILGGGFGGLYTAVRLENLMWPRDKKPKVTLIDQNDRFVFKPLLYELINGGARPEEVAPPFAELLAPYPTQFIQDGVHSVHERDGASAPGGSSGGQVKLRGGGVVEYDWLVLAMGSSTTFFDIPGVKELAFPFCDYKDAMQALRQLEMLEQRQQASGSLSVTVVGAGYAGIELATTLAERIGPRGFVQIIHGGNDIMEPSSAGQRDAAKRMLMESNVSVTTNALVSKVERLGDAPQSQLGPDLSRRRLTLKMSDERQQVIDSDMVFWTAGSGPVTKTAAQKLSLPFPTDKRGLMQTDAMLRVLHVPHVFAMGDIAGVAESNPETTPPPTAQVAFQQADYVAWNLWAAINNRPLLPFRYQHLGDMMSLGRSKGAVTLPLPVPHQLASAAATGPLGSFLQSAGISLGTQTAEQGVTLEGPLAGALRRAAYWYRQPTDAHRLTVGRNWLQQALQEAQGMMGSAGPRR
ncbi:hypothetical protein WJX84_003805 [Apatococcus fuscideae]|uniref:FAD/NAD(P)-binding domain-containing protein n=1 Tax=Apatococcus fuscideae TaxID=2026836 RepID=A0AAW1SXP8_9CHLO